MQLTFILLLVLTIAAVVALVFLVRLLIQLRITGEEAGKTLAEVRVLVRNLNELDLEIKARVEEVGGSLGVFRKAAVGLSKAAMLVTLKLLPAPAKYLPFVLPAACLAVRQIKNWKENRHVE